MLRQHYHVLNKKKKVVQVVDLKKKDFKNQVPDKSLRFEGIIKTYGVGMSIVKQNTTTNRKTPTSKTFIRKQAKTKKEDDFEASHIEELDKGYLNKTIGRCVLIDLGCRDPIYCMKEASTVEKKQILIFTKINISQFFRHYRS